MQNQIKNQGSIEEKLQPIVKYVALSVIFVFGILSIIASFGGEPAPKKPNLGLQTNEELRAEIRSLQRRIQQLKEEDEEYQEAIRQGYPIRSSSSEAVAHEARMAEINRIRDHIRYIESELKKRGPEE